MTCNKLPAFRENDWSAPDVIVSEKKNGIQYVNSPYSPLNDEGNVIGMFQDTVAQYPNRNFIGRRNKDNNDWEFITYKEADEQSSAIAQWLLNLDLEVKNPVMILSENSFEHALFMLGALKAGMPVAPTSPNYCLLSVDHQKIKNIYSLIEPAIVFCQNLNHYHNAIKSFNEKNLKVVFVEGDDCSLSTSKFENIVNTPITTAVNKSIATIQPQDIAKILFTSGSTGEPKGVINTHGNLVSTVASLGAIVRIDAVDNPPVMLDWMPWHHTFGGNQIVHRVMRYGGTLYIDEGKPVPQLFDKTVANLTSIAVNGYTTVPAVYSMLAKIMKTNTALRKNFFKNLEWISYGGSDMPQSTYDEIQEMAIAETGQRIPIVTGLGSTESSSLITALHWPTEEMGNIGLPIPSTTIKLCPIDDKYEMRIKGPQITPSYFKNTEKTKEAFDDEGYFITGDAVRWKDEKDYKKGLIFAGRVCEDFKLLNGSWVHTDALRTNVISSLFPLVDDLVVAGQDKSYISLLLWINEAALRKLFNDQDSTYNELLFSKKLSAHLENALQQYNQQNKGSTSRILKVINMSEPPSLDDGEISDKRSINQRAVLKNKAHLVERLYAETPDEQVIVIGK